MSGGGSGGSQTTTQTTSAPQWEQNFGQGNNQLAGALMQNPFPVYQAPRIAQWNPFEQNAGSILSATAPSYQTGLNEGLSTAQGALKQQVNPTQALGIPSQIQVASPMAAMGIPGSIPVASPMAAMGSIGANPGVAPGQTFGAAGAQTWNPAAAQRYMSPYEQAALAPQLTQMQTELGQEQNRLGAQATQDSAFGDARQGVAQAWQNFLGNQAMSGVEAQGMNSAYQTGQNAFAQDQANKLSAYGTGLQGQLQYGNLGLGAYGAGQNAYQGQVGANLAAYNAGQGAYTGQTNAALQAFGQALGGSQAEQGIQQQGANQLANMGALSQQLGANWANSAFGYGQQNQNYQQNALDTAYQAFMNQSMWPYQMAGFGTQTLGQTPNLQSTTTNTVPGPSGAASTIGLGSTALGGIGQVLGGIGSLFG